MDGVLFCKPHFEQLFKESGSLTKKSTCKITYAINSDTIGIIVLLFSSLLGLTMCLFPSWTISWKTTKWAGKYKFYQFHLSKFSEICLVWFFMIYEHSFPIFYRIGPLASSPPCFLGHKKNVKFARKQYTLWRRFAILFFSFYHFWFAAMSFILIHLRIHANERSHIYVLYHCTQWHTRIY